MEVQDMGVMVAEGHIYLNVIYKHIFNTDI